MIFDGEIFRAVPGYGGDYFCSRSGRVLTMKWRLPRLLAQNHRKTGYRSVQLSKKDIQSTFLIHRLVAITWIGPIPNGREINHKNGVRDDNRIENIEIVTPSQNQKHRAMVLKKGIGEDNPNNKLTTRIVRQIKRAVTSGQRPIDVSRRLGVKYSSVWAIKVGQNWGHLET